MTIKLNCTLELGTKLENLPLCCICHLDGTVFRGAMTERFPESSKLRNLPF
jgi:hypothetical protein